MTVNVSPPATGQSWVRPWWDRTLAPTTGAPSTRVGPRRKTGSILAPPSKPHPPGEIKDPSGAIHARRIARDRSSDGVEPGHTTRPTDRSKSAHAVEFSKTVAPLLEGTPPQGHARFPNTGSRGGPTSIALGSGVIALAIKLAPSPLVRLGQDTTWTVIVRSRARSSKSISTICCQVPSVRRPSITGIVSDGPTSAARRWACELVS
jgi:hypothetical protein